MGRFIVTLTDDERVKLEAHRVALGKRSHADVIRHWIEDAPSIESHPGYQFRVREGRRAIEETRKNAEANIVVPGMGPLHLGPVPARPGSRLKKR